MTPLAHARWLASLLWDLLPAEQRRQLGALERQAPWLGGEWDAHADRELVSTQQAAEIAGVGASTVRQWAHRGRLTAAERRGREALYWRADVEALSASRSGG